VKYDRVYVITWTTMVVTLLYDVFEIAYLDKIMGYTLRPYKTEKERREGNVQKQAISGMGNGSIFQKDGKDPKKSNFSYMTLVGKPI